MNLFIQVQFILMPNFTAHSESPYFIFLQFTIMTLHAEVQTIKVGS